MVEQRLRVVLEMHYLELPLSSFSERICGSLEIQEAIKWETIELKQIPLAR